MTIIKYTKNTETEKSTAVVSEPAAGAILEITHDFEFQLSELDYDATETNTVEVVVRDTDDSNESSVSTFDTDAFSTGSVDDPVAVAGAGREIAVLIENAGSTDSEYILNYEVEKRMP